MEKTAVFPARFHGNLTDGLDEGLAFDIADGAADLADDHVRPALFAHVVDKRLDFVGDVRNDLHGLPQIVAVPLLVQHVPIHLARREVAVLIEVFVDKALVVPQIEVGFRAVLGDEHLPVLIGAHRAGVDVDIGIEFLRSHLVASRFEQSSQARRGDALAKSRHHAARYEYIFHSSTSP